MCNINGDVFFEIGKNSSGENHHINLTNLPNLFISYSDNSQLISSFKNIIKTLSENNTELKFAFSTSQKFYNEIANTSNHVDIAYLFNHDYKVESDIKSIDEFIEKLYAHWRLATKINKANYKDKLPLIPLVVFIDDIFEIIKANKKTATHFIELLINGAAGSIYFIVASSGLYKNLLHQIIQPSQSLQNKLPQKSRPINLNLPLAAELVINPDGLLFFRERDKNDYEKFYPNNF